MRPDIRIVELPSRRVCVRRHEGGLETVDVTRRPMYQHMIMHELVAGASMVRHRDEGLDVLIGAASGFQGDDVLDVELLPAGQYAVADWEGAESDIDAARGAFLDALAQDGYVVDGEVLQVHLMDAIEGVTEQQFQIRLAKPAS